MEKGVLARLSRSIESTCTVLHCIVPFPLSLLDLARKLFI